MSKKCLNVSCIIHILAKSSNTLLLICSFIGFSQAYGQEKLLFLLVGIVPVLSIIALSKSGDREERKLKKRIRKAHLRKELDDLKQFDEPKQA